MIKISHIFHLSEIHQNRRLDQALAKLLPDYSRTQIQSWIETGCVHINGKIAKSKNKMKGGETISIKATMESPSPSSRFEAQAIPLNIIHEDDALIVINKPAGMVVHPGAGTPDHTLLNALLYHAPSLQALPRAGILHRLDKNTSGLLVIAKTAPVLKELSQQLKARTLLREYQAIVYGLMISGGTVDAPVERHPLHRKRMAVTETGKHAITHYRVAEKYHAHTRLHIRLDTGRTHQIRVHMAHIQHPVVGDTTYGGRLQLTKGMTTKLIEVMRQFKRQALHAAALGLTHPISHQFIRWESELPEDMKTLVDALRNDVLNRR